VNSSYLADAAKLLIWAAERGKRNHLADAWVQIISSGKEIGSTPLPNIPETHGARGKGRILNVASLAGFQPLPSMAVYAASKAYVLSLTEALAEELRGKGVTVTALCPGFTDTNMVESAKRENAAFRTLPSALIADPKSVAREGYRACMNGDVIRVPGLALQMATGLLQAQRSITRTLTGLLGRRAL
jgi:uncharacterized protein